jgi:hypothetical protein
MRSLRSARFISTRRAISIAGRSQIEIVGTGTMPTFNNLADLGFVVDDT